MRAARVVLAAAIAASLVSTGCGRTQNEFDGPMYDSIDSLTAQEGVVVVAGVFRGEPGDATERELGATFEFEDQDGLDLEVWQFEVKRTIVGETPTGVGAISVTQIVLPAPSADAQRERSQDEVLEPVYTARAGRESLLFLRAYPDDRTFAVLGLGAGSFEIFADGTISAPEGVDEALAREVRSLGTAEAVVERLELGSERTS